MIGFRIDRVWRLGFIELWVLGLQGLGFRICGLVFRILGLKTQKLPKDGARLNANIKCLSFKVKGNNILGTVNKGYRMWTIRKQELNCPKT